LTSIAGSSISCDETQRDAETQSKHRHRGRARSVLAGIFAYAQGWEIPRGASTEQSPLSPTAAVLKKGRLLYVSRCAKCHGPEGKGDGPDGVLFYKIWNGRTQPTMPALKTKLTRNDVWAIVEYVKTLRKPPGP
jgi:mono/diheme cytochrome c family protein